MTTIAFCKGWMASDSRSLRKDLIDGDTKKIWRLPDGSLFGGSGDYMSVLKILQLLRVIARSKPKHVKLPTEKLKCECLLADGKSLWLYEKGYWEKITQKYYSIGSGWLPARVAMEHGASAREAVKAAIGKDVYSGGRVQALKL